MNTRMAELHRIANDRLLKRGEQVELMACYLKLRTDEPHKLVSRLYAMAKQYDRAGGADLYNSLMHLAGDLTLDFGILYAALKLV